MKNILVLVVSCFTFTLQAKTLKCGGTEPFWGAEINTSTGIVKISDPVNEKNASIKTKIIAAAGTSEDYAFLAKGKHVSLSVVANESCTDGMSEEKYTHSVMLIGYSSSPFIGCCIE